MLTWPQNDTNTNSEDLNKAVIYILACTFTALDEPRLWNGIQYATCFVLAIIQYDRSIFSFQLSMDNEELQSLLTSSQTNQNQLKTKVTVPHLVYDC